EQPAAAQHQPGFVPVPLRRHRVHRHRATLLLAEHREENADAEIEAVEQHVGEHGDGKQHHPDERQVHHASSRIHAVRRRSSVSRSRSSSRSSSTAPAAGSWRSRRSRYRMPMPNTTTYTTTNAVKDPATAGRAIGETESAVRRSPYTVYGWRPTSVTVQPHRIATRPEGDAASAARHRAGESYSRRRRRCTRLHRPMPAMTRPRPTMMRKLQKTVATCGQSARSKRSSPVISASGEWPRMTLPAFGIASGQRTVAASWAGNPTR